MATPTVLATAMSAQEKLPQVRPPWWVRILLWGSSTRNGVMLYVWASLVLAGVSLAAGFWKPRYFLGTTLILSAVAYWAAICWVDRHGCWPEKNPKEPRTK